MTDNPAPRWPSRVSGIELAGLAVIVAIGLFLRASFFAENAIEHFDEGVYASNWYCRPPGLPDLTYPQQHLYAPPLWPEVLRQTLFWSTGNPQSVLWVNVLLGTLTIVAVWWTPRAWTGASGALAGALLCAVSDLHIGLSRMALTDVPLTLLLVLSVGCGVRGIARKRLLWLIASALCATLAWWTKYNGWLALAITGAGVGGLLVFHRPRVTPASGLIARWGLIAILVGLLWLPVVWSLADVGGYSVIAANHSRYVVGITGWWNSSSQQALKLMRIDSWPAWCALVGAVLLVDGRLTRISRGPDTTRLSRWMDRLVMPSFAAIVALLHGVTVGLLSVAAISLFRRRSDLADLEHTETLLGRWTVRAGFIGLALATPMYWPYPRLMLPLTLLSWLAVALREQRIPPAVGLTVKRHPTWVLPLVCLAPTIGLLAIGCGPKELWPGVASYPRDGQRLIAQRIIDGIHRESTGTSASSTAVIYVYAEPALFYHLSAIRDELRANIIVQPIGSFDVLESAPIDTRATTYLVSSRHWQTMVAELDAYDGLDHRDRLKHAGTFRYYMGPLDTLDEDWHKLERASQRCDVTLDRLLPAR
jgi:dolichyl-phosphate-mannose-protein mannosyltransferase